MRTVLFLASVAILLSNSPAEAKIEPFLEGGGATNRTTKDGQNELLDPIEIVDWKGSWQAGVGVRLYSHDRSGFVGENPRWEVRARLGGKGGSLADEYVEFHRDRPPVWSRVSDEKFDYSGWYLSTSIVGRVLPGLGLFLAPGLELLRFESTIVEIHEGDIPEFCPCEDSDTSSSAKVLYGVFELGARIEPTSSGLGVEMYWIPRRSQMSKSQTVGDGGYSASFAKLDSSVGMRLTYDF